MTTLLAIDTAADICSVAITQNSTIHQRAGLGVRTHAADVLPLIQSLLDETSLTLTQLDAIVIVSGPGSFTGLRIGTAVAQGLSFGADIPIIRISSLMMQARTAFNASGQCHGTDCILYTCMHAREDEFYFACYRDDGASLPKVLIQDQISDAASILSWLQSRDDNNHPRFCSGNGWLHNALKSSRGYGIPVLTTDGSGTADILCDLGGHAFVAGLVERADDALPVYLKEDMAYRKS